MISLKVAVVSQSGGKAGTGRCQRIMCNGITGISALHRPVTSAMTGLECTLFDASLRSVRKKAKQKGRHSRDGTGIGTRVVCERGFECAVRLSAHTVSWSHKKAFIVFAIFATHSH